MNPIDKALFHILQRCGLIAILRGVQPHEVVAIGHALYDAGFRIIEVPLNSPSRWLASARCAMHCPLTAWWAQAPCSPSRPSPMWPQPVGRSSSCPTANPM